MRVGLVASYLTDVTLHSVPDYALYEQKPTRGGSPRPTEKLGWGSGRSWAVAGLGGVEVDRRPGVTVRHSELCGTPNWSVASQWGPVTPPLGRPDVRPAGTPFPGPDVALPTGLPREARPLPPASPPPLRVFVSLLKRDFLQAFLGTRSETQESGGEFRPNPQGRHPGRAAWSPPAPGGLRTTTRGRRDRNRNRSPSRI